MPSETFYKLSDEKKEKIIEAALKEYSRVPPDLVLVKNIVEDAGIARGSFYQYFESKDDLLSYILKKDLNEIENFIIKDLEKFPKKDIFEIYIDIFDFVTNNTFNSKRIEFHKKMLKNIKLSDDKFIALYAIFSNDSKLKEPLKRFDFINKVDKTNLNIKSEEDINFLLEMLFLITVKSLVDGFEYLSFEKARKEYIKKIELLKYGVLK